MKKGKRIPKTVYMAPSIWEMVDQRAAICNRTRNEQIEFMIEMCLKYQADNDELAISMAERAEKNRS